MNIPRLALIILIAGILSLAIGVYIYVSFSSQSIHMATNDCFLQDKTLCKDQTTVQNSIRLIPLTILGAWGGFLILISLILWTAKPAQAKQ